MPGSNEYSINPDLREETSAVTPKVTPAAVSAPKTSGNPILPYKMRQFQDVRAREMYGTEMDRRDQRRFNRYLRSAQGMADAANFDAREASRAAAANDYATQYNASLLKSRMPQAKVAVAASKPVLKEAQAPPPAAPTPPPPTPPADPVLKPKTTDWNAVARQNGFADMAAVAKWQGENGLVADGMFGMNSRAKWNELQQAQQNPELETKPIEVVPQEPVVKAPTPKFDLAQFARNNGLEVTRQHGQDLVRWDPSGFGDFWIDASGNIYEGGVLFDNTKKVNIKSGLGYGARKARYEELQKAIAGLNESTNTYGMKIEESKPQESTYHTPKMSTYRTFYKQGGTMNKIKYFQQGGAAPQQQDMQQQVMALVQAAMQGDQKATQTVNQIMEAAKAGDQQAIQIAQMMEQIVKQMQGQATAAKWGAKLGYIRSLKYAKGGKTCPACEKKVEMKACGGKKAKKHREGGDLIKERYITSVTMPDYYGYKTTVEYPTRNANVLGGEHSPRRVILHDSSRHYDGSFENDTLYFNNAAEQNKFLKPSDKHIKMLNPYQLRKRFGDKNILGDYIPNKAKDAFESHINNTKAFDAKYR